MASMEKIDISAKPKNNEEAVVCKDGKQKCYASTRCGLLPFTRFVKGLSEEKRNSIKDVGFGGLLGLRIKQNRNVEVIELMRRFNWQTQTLRVHGKELKLTEEVVWRILGLPYRGRDITKLKSNSGHVRQKYNVRRESRNDLIEELCNMETGEEWQANFIFLANHCVLRPSSSLSCSPSNLEFLDDVSNSREMNWCKYVLDGLCVGAKDLQVQVAKFEKGERSSVNLKGCTILLERSLPRLLDWTDESMRRVYASTGRDFDDHSVSLVDTNVDEGPIRFPHTGIRGQQSSMDDMGDRVSMSTVLQKINTHERRLERIEKQVQELRSIIEHFVRAGMGQRVVQVNGSAKDLGGVQNEVACPSRMPNEEAANPKAPHVVEEGTSRLCPPENKVAIGCSKQVTGWADDLVDCCRASPPARIYVEDVRVDKEEAIDEIEETNTGNVGVLEKDPNEVVDEGDVGKGITDNTKPLNVYLRKSIDKQKVRRQQL